jgi:hypothetical protein
MSPLSHLLLVDLELREGLLALQHDLPRALEHGLGQRRARRREHDGAAADELRQQHLEVRHEDLDDVRVQERADRLHGGALLLARGLPAVVRREDAVEGLHPALEE